MSYRHLFFDLDRTLWDMERNSREALLHLYERHGLQEKGVPSFEAFFAFYNPYNQLLWDRYQRGLIDKHTLRILRFRQTLAHFGVKNDQLAQLLSEGYLAEAPKKNLLVEGTMEILAYLQQKNYVIHLLTNGFEEVQQFKVDNCGLRPFITELITSDRSGCLKPDARMFDFALRASKAGIRESLMIGDSLETDIIGAREAGWDTVFFNPDKEPHTQKPTFEIQSLLELKNIL